MLFRILLLEIGFPANENFREKLHVRFLCEISHQSVSRKNAKFSQNKKCESNRNRLTQKFILEKKDPNLA